MDKFQKEKYDLEQRNEELTKALKAEENLRLTEGREKEKEKIQATEKLRKEMLYKIKETKANLLALNDE